MVDDRRVMPFPARYARTSVRAIELLDHITKLEQLWLDHDLGGDDTTMVVADWMAKQAFCGCPLDVDLIYVHSANGPGAQRLMLTLQRWYPRVQRVPAPAARVYRLCRLCILLLERPRRVRAKRAREHEPRQRWPRGTMER